MSKPSSGRSAAAPAVVFAALGDPTRLELIARLNDGQARSITHLADGLYLSRQAVTKHLRVLERAGIVRSRAVGRESRFAYVPEPIDLARSYLETVSAQWDAALCRLKSFVETKHDRKGRTTRKRR